MDLSDVKRLREITGCGMNLCARALEKCKTPEVAAEYLRLKGQAVARYKVLPDKTKVRWKDEDYIAEAERITKAP